jgi:hypothetical protein
LGICVGGDDLEEGEGEAGLGLLLGDCFFGFEKLAYGVE